jgi:hypothetical protein
MKFSERIGAVRRALQKDSMDEALKNSLWNVVYQQHLDPQGDDGDLERLLLLSLWTDHFHQPVDDAAERFTRLLAQVRERYMESGWCAVYDFLEFVASYSGSGEDYNSRFIAKVNATLETQLSAYRFVGTTLAPITSEEEILAIEQAMSHGNQFKPAVAHLETALARLADRASPDYRNSIKESISAVEAVCQILAGDPKATLGQALKKIGIHPALEKGFSSIYGYTSDADGIRHALSEESTVDADDAKFFLVSCSAFVNYLIAKSAENDP